MVGVLGPGAGVKQIPGFAILPICYTICSDSLKSGTCPYEMRQLKELRRIRK
jgi:hypothetical protein